MGRSLVWEQRRRSDRFSWREPVSRIKCGACFSPENALNRMHGKPRSGHRCRQPLQACAPAARIRRTGRGSPPRTDALDLIPAKFVNENCWECAATEIGARRCRARSAWRRRAGFTQCGPTVCRTCMPGDDRVRNGREDGTAAVLGATRELIGGCLKLRSPSRRGGLGKVFVELVLDRRERAERLGRERDRLAVAVGR